ncbi:MAG: glycosyltransferase [Candidatus Saccharimonadales bacterium]
MTALSLSRLSRESHRKIEFLIVGGLVMMFSFVQLWLLIDVCGLNYWLAYVIQTVISVELNFFGNYIVAWRDKKDSINLNRAHSLFWLTRGVMVVLNPFIFAWIVKVGVGYLIAQLIVVAGNTVLNYVAADKLAFRGGHAKRSAQATGTATVSSHAVTCNDVAIHQPFVSVIVPVKGRHATIRELVESYLAQDYSGKSELILVGDINDSTWRAISDYTDAGRIRVIETDIESEDRDANAKRNVGLASARGDVLVLTDSDVILPPTWLSHGIDLMRQDDGYHVVAGGLHSIKENGFWSSYTDDNPIGSKTPRMTPAYVLTQQNCGKGRFKQPITASMFLDRQVYETVGGLDADFVTPYEDYPYADVIVRAGYTILCDGDLVAYHYHREGFKSLTGEYWKAGYGCADYVLMYPFSRLAASRAFQLLIIAVGIIVGGISLLLLPAATLIFAAFGLSVVSVVVWCKVRQARALLFPAITVLLSSIFATGMAYGFCKRFWTNQQPTLVRAITENSSLVQPHSTMEVA